MAQIEVAQIDLAALVTALVVGCGATLTGKYSKQSTPMMQTDRPTRTWRDRVSASSRSSVPATRG